MRRTCQTALPLVIGIAFLGFGCKDMERTSRSSKVGDQSKETKATPFATPTRAEAIVRIAELGGQTAPPSPTPEDMVLLVDLSSTQATDADLMLLGALPELQHLDLSGTRITNDGLKHIAVLKELSSLKLKKTSVTGPGLTHLKSLPQLCHLDVTDTRLQESDLARLKGMKSRLSVLPFSQQAVKAWITDKELAVTEWTTSSDGVLSLRLLASKIQSVSSEVIVVMAELRNDSKKDWVVLRPLADWWKVYISRLVMRGPKGAVEYDMSQGVPTYTLGRSSLSLLGPGQVIRDQIELPASLFKGLDVAGEYSFTLKYSVDKAQYENRTARLFPEGKPEFWTGEMRSKELKIIKLRK